MTLNIELTGAEVEDLITVLTESRDEYSNVIEEYSSDAENDWSIEIEDCYCRRAVINKLLGALK